MKNYKRLSLDEREEISRMLADSAGQHLVFLLLGYQILKQIQNDNR